LAWKDALELVRTKAHCDTSLAGRDALVKFLEIGLKINVTKSKTYQRKRMRYEFLISWLKSLEGVPTKQQRQDMIAQLGNLK
jgi:hypothetical protein